MITDKKFFDEIIDAQLKDCKDLLAKKFEEYQFGKDLLSNFNNIADMLNITPEAAWLGMWIKHVESIVTMIKGKETFCPSSKWDEKITDCINYLILLQCLLNQDYIQVGGIPVGHWEKTEWGDNPEKNIEDYSFKKKCEIGESHCKITRPESLLSNQDELANQ